MSGDMSMSIAVKLVVMLKTNFRGASGACAPHERQTPGISGRGNSFFRPIFKFSCWGECLREGAQSRAGEASAAAYNCGRLKPTFGSRPTSESSYFSGRRRPAERRAAFLTLGRAGEVYEAAARADRAVELRPRVRAWLRCLMQGRVVRRRVITTLGPPRVVQQVEVAVAGHVNDEVVVVHVYLLRRAAPARRRAPEVRRDDVDERPEQQRLALVV